MDKNEELQEDSQQSSDQVIDYGDSLTYWDLSHIGIMLKFIWVYKG